MVEQMNDIARKVFPELTYAYGGFGTDLLADTISDRMYDLSVEFRNLPDYERRAMVWEVATNYI
jgi:hypothetical protein